MDSIVGQTISHYRIVARLGVRGETYKAEDTRSGLAVSLRFFSPELLGDSQGGAQLQRLARALGGVRQRHIAELYEAGEWDGRTFWATELPEGESLAQRIASHPLAFREVLDVGVQIADVLDAAHAAGLVHGGLCPENIFISRTGEAKVTDLGLAAIPVPGLVPSSCQAPEQLRGEQADARADLFALGAVLYEMASGKAPFSATSADAVREAVLTRDVPPASESNPDLPVRFDEIVSKALEKDRELRYQFAAELRGDLRRLRRDWDSDRVAATRAAVVVTPPAQMKEVFSGFPGLDNKTPARSKRAWALGILVGLVVGAAAGIAALHRLQRPVPHSPIVFHRVTFDRGRVSSARFGPHGQTIFYTGLWNGAPPRVFSISPGSPESVPLGLHDAEILSISFANELAILAGIHFTLDGRAQGDLREVALAGGSQQSVVENVEAADWAPAGTELAIVRRVKGMDRLEYPIGKVLVQTAGWISDPRFSPLGTSIAYLDHPALDSAAGSVDLVDLSGKRKVVSAGWTTVRGLAWSAKGRQVWFTAARSGTPRVYAASLSGHTRQVAASAGSLRLEDIARDGRVLIAREDARWQIAEIARGQTSQRDLSWLNGSELCDVSADGKTILFNEVGPAGGKRESIYVRPTDGAAATRVGVGRALALSPDGKTVLAETLRAPRHLVLLPVGAGSPVNLPAAAVRYKWAAWLPQGKRFVFLGRERGQGLQLFVQNVAGGPPQAISPAGLGHSAALSPNGRLVAAIGPDGKGYLYPVEGGSVALLPGLTRADTLLGWNRYGSAVFVSEGTLPVKVFLLGLAGAGKTPLYQLAPADPAGVRRLGTIRLTPDGNLCFFSYRRTLSSLYVAEGLH
jgi:Tol biopolymer transport system component